MRRTKRSPQSLSTPRGAPKELRLRGSPSFDYQKLLSLVLLVFLGLLLLAGWLYFCYSLGVLGGLWGGSAPEDFLPKQEEALSPEEVEDLTQLMRFFVAATLVFYLLGYLSKYL